MLPLLFAPDFAAMTRRYGVELVADQRHGRPLLVATEEYGAGTRVARWPRRATRTAQPRRRITDMGRARSREGG